MPRFAKDVDKQAAAEEGAQVAAVLDTAEPAGRKPSFPADAVAQTAAVFAALAGASEPLDAATLAGAFSQNKIFLEHSGRACLARAPRPRCERATEVISK